MPIAPRPPWDDRVFDACKHNARKPLNRRVYFSKVEDDAECLQDQHGLKRRSKDVGAKAGQRLCARCRAALSSPSGSAAAVQIHLPDQDNGIDDFGGPFAHDNVTNGQVPSFVSAAQPYVALSPDDLLAEFQRRRTEITSILSRNWTSPASVRLLKKELVELEGWVKQYCVHSASYSRRSSCRNHPEAPATPPPKPLASLDDCGSTGKEAAPASRSSKGKGKGPPPPPVFKMKQQSSSSASSLRGGRTPRNPGPPFGRSLHWQRMPQERVAGTVWDGLDKDLEVDFEVLQRLFGKATHSSAKEICPKPCSAVEIFTLARAQQILIALQRCPLSDNLLHALRVMDMACPDLSLEACEVLSAVMLTTDEADQLMAYSGDVACLRSAERQVLPVARMRDPTARERLRIFKFQHLMSEVIAEVHDSLGGVSLALALLRRSGAFRAFLQHVLALGNALNLGAAAMESESANAGFAVDALLRLSVCRSTSSTQASLLHVLICQAQRAQPGLLDPVSEVLRSCKTASETPLAKLASDIEEFRASAAALRTSVETFWPAQADATDSQGAGTVDAGVQAAIEAVGGRATSCVRDEASTGSSGELPAEADTLTEAVDTVGKSAESLAEEVAEGPAEADMTREVVDISRPADEDATPHSVSQEGVEGETHQAGDHQALALLMTKATKETHAMEQALSSVRKEATEVLAYFADSVAVDGFAQVDGRSHELFCVLRDFQREFEQARAELARSRKLADSCGGACSSPSLHEQTLPLESETFCASIFEDLDSTA